MPVRKEKTRNAGTFTEAAFWGWIRSALRRRSIYWKPIQQVRMDARIPYEGPPSRTKWLYKCSECGGYFKAKDTEVDHIVPCGSLKCGDDLVGFVERLFCEKDGLRVLCHTCHDKITHKRVD